MQERARPWSEVLSSALDDQEQRLNEDRAWFGRQVLIYRDPTRPYLVLAIIHDGIAICGGSDGLPVYYVEIEELRLWPLNGQNE
jgi:hypothetical protein